MIAKSFQETNSILLFVLFWIDDKVEKNAFFFILSLKWKIKE